ncbi:E3 ubiquitin-protein ligase AIP2-like [Chenopodium quinoa]|uniref:E3 ubiquitin-protein ligase AIP2-like n=1 Tax=Chenopodium quinoa TaxID=63459 RepID=UPI000B7906C4|nr:E3 ubiquitin-protein ligase AIP2-like [Chenopodium quinoa]
MASNSSKPSDEELTNQLQQLRTQLNKKQTFESAVSSIKSLLLQSYSTSSPSTQKLFYDVVSRVATVIRTRYTFPAYLLAGVDLLETADRLTVNPAEKTHLNSCITHFRQTLNQEDPENGGERISQSNRRGGYLFEGHLTVDQEPAQPNWLVQQNLLTALAAQSQTAGENGDSSNDEVVGSLMRGLVESLDVSMLDNLEDLLPPMEGTTGRVAPPASKEVVEKLPVIKLESEEMVKEKIGEEGAECCICKEKLGVGDEMQEMPCKHLFHPPCLKPWLDEHNSCPICRHELPTDDHKYESWKEREKELEEERRGAANAVRGGEFMYI